MTTEKELGMRLRSQRKRLLLTQQELADKCGLSLQHIGDIERGQANPTYSCLCRLADTMGIDVGYFFDSTKKEELNIDDKKIKLIEFIKTAKGKQIDIFYIVYKGML